MTKKIIFLICLFISLVCVICFEQIYTERAISEVGEKVKTLQSYIGDNDLDLSSKQSNDIISTWKDREKIICLFVDYRDIEQISRQANLVYSHLSNHDFELAKVECSALLLALDNFKNMVKFDFFNIF